MALAMVNEVKTYRGMLAEHELLSRHTSWRTGGMASHFYRPADIEDLQLFLSTISENEPVYWITFSEPGNSSEDDIRAFQGLIKVLRKIFMK